MTFSCAYFPHEIDQFARIGLETHVSKNGVPFLYDVHVLVIDAHVSVLSGF